MVEHCLAVSHHLTWDILVLYLLFVLRSWLVFHLWILRHHYWHVYKLLRRQENGAITKGLHESPGSKNEFDKRNAPKYQNHQNVRLGKYFLEAHLRNTILRAEGISQGMEI